MNGPLTQLVPRLAPASRRPPLRRLLRSLASYRTFLPATFYSDECGQAILETAIVMPGFVLLLFGSARFSMALTSYHGGSYAIRSAARYGSTHSATSPSPAAVADIQHLVAVAPFVPAGAQINVSYVGYQGAASGNYTGNVLYVQLQYSQTISLVGYSKTFTVTSSTFRYILR